MRGDYQRERTSVLTWLISALIAGFVVQLLFAAPWFRVRNDALDGVILSVPALQAGWLWTLLTHSFLHSPQFIFHIVVNIAALYLLGRELLPMLGRRRFLGLYAVATVVGGLAWAAVHWDSGVDASHLGASAAVAAFFIVFACFFPNQELNFLLFFLFPVTLKPKQIAWTLVALDVLGLMFWEIPNAPLPFGATIASSAHLGGMLTGFLFYRFVYDSTWFGRAEAEAAGELPRWLKRPSKPVPAPPPPSELGTSVRSPEDLRAEVDRILDKINSEGFGSLTPDEKRVLDSARQQLSRH